MKRYRVRLDLNETEKQGKLMYSLWSGGSVDGHVHEALLEDVKFVILEEGQAVTRKTGVRTIHAWMEASLGKEEPKDLEGWQRFGYNPKTDKGFNIEGKLLEGADSVWISGSNRYLCNPRFV